jgi:hypothetical protein
MRVSAAATHEAKWNCRMCGGQLGVGFTQLPTCLLLRLHMSWLLLLALPQGVSDGRSWRAAYAALRMRLLWWGCCSTSWIAAAASVPGLCSRWACRWQWKMVGCWWLNALLLLGLVRDTMHAAVGA